jgi:hypothetical protein
VYRMLHHVDPPVRGSVVICPPLANEWANSQRVLVNLARHVAGAGWSVCRFDYWATGESPGVLEDCDFDSFVDSAVAVIESSTLKPLALIAVRAAALFIDAVLSRVADVAGVLWIDPVCSGADYVKELRLAATLSGLQDGSAGAQREDGGLDVGSFVFRAELLRQFEAIASSPAREFPSTAGGAAAANPTSRAVVWTTPPKAGQASALGTSVHHIKDVPRFWAKKDQFRSSDLEAAIATWLHQLSGARHA